LPARESWAIPARMRPSTVSRSASVVINSRLEFRRNKFALTVFREGGYGEK
jgi:hypothetical protein